MSSQEFSVLRRAAWGTIESSTGAWPGSFKKIEICGDRGHAIIEEDRASCWEFKDEPVKDISDFRDEPGGRVKDPIDIGYLAHMKQIEDCIRAVQEKRAPAVTAQDARRAVELVLRLYKEAGLRP